MGTRLNTATSSNTDGPSYTVSAGSNRALIVGVTQEVASPSIPTVTYGGQSMTRVDGIAVGDATDQRVDIYYLNDAGIVAATGTTVTVTGEPAAFTLHMASYQDVMQTTPTVTATHAVTGAGTTVLSFTSQNTSVAVVLGGMGNGGTVVWSGGVTEQTEQADVGATATGSLADEEVVTGAAETYTGTWTTANRRAGVGLLLTDLSGPSIDDVDSDYGAASDEFDLDENSLDVNGSGFEASQGVGTVYISDASTLAGSVNEEDIDAAINTWSDTVVNLNLTTLTTELAALETLGIGARWIILVNASSDEVSIPVTIHRAKAFILSETVNIPASGAVTTAQLTAPAAGTFGGGRIQDDENPADTVNVGDGQYGEWEWAIEGVDPPDGTYQGAQPDETYQFRVLINGVVADVITVTPTWTITQGIEIVHTTDAIKQEQDTPLSHTTDAIKQEQDLTEFHTTDAIVQEQDITVAHTADANTTIAVTRVFTTDAIVLSLTDPVEQGFGPLVDPLVHTGHLLRVGVGFPDDGGSDQAVAYMQLRQGASVIQEFNVVLNEGDEQVEDNAITSVNAANITDYNDLRFYGWFESTTRNLDEVGNEPYFYFLELLVPDFSAVAHTTDALLEAPSATIDHTTDARLVDRLTVEHSTDAIKQEQDIIVVHTTDAIKLEEIEGSHTTDAIKLEEIETTHTADALLQATEIRTHTTDAHLVERITVDHTTDAHLVDRQSENHTTDARLVDRQTENHTTDAIKLEEIEQTHTTDAILQEQDLTVEHTTDAIKLEEQEQTHTTDAFTPDRFTQEHTTDAITPDRLTDDHTTDAIKREEIEQTHTTDGILQEQDIPLVHTTDAIKLEEIELDHTTDARLRFVLTLDHTTDAIGVDRQTVDHTADAIVQEQDIVLDHTTTAILLEDQMVMHDTDAIKLEEIEGTHTADAHLVDRITVDHTTDARLVDRQTVDHTTDAILQEQDLTDLHTTDAIKLEEIERSHTTDAIKLDTFTPNHTTDAITPDRLTQDHTTDARLVVRSTEEHTTDAILQEQDLTENHTTDAIVQGPEERNHTTDALLQATIEADHTTDAIKLETIEVAHTTDALTRIRVTPTHTTDAIKLEEIEAAHTTDARLIFRSTEVHTTDAILKETIELTHTTEGHLVDRLTPDHTTDAVVQEQDIIVVHTNDAHLVERVPIVHTTDAIKVEVIERTHTTDAITPDRLTDDHTTDAILQEQDIIVVHTTDAELAEFQYSYPISDLAAGDWDSSPTPAQDLFQQVNEPGQPDDDDYIWDEV